MLWRIVSVSRHRPLVTERSKTPMLVLTAFRCCFGCVGTTRLIEKKHIFCAMVDWIVDVWDRLPLLVM